MKSERGFSLSELLIASLVMSLIMGGLYSLMESTQTYYENYSDELDMLQGTRVALDFMGNEMRLAGYDMGDDLSELLTAASDTSVEFVGDIDDGDAAGACDAIAEAATDGGAERVTYSLDVDTASLVRTVDCYDGTVWTLDVENAVVISNLDVTQPIFRFYDFTGTQVPLGGGTLDADTRSDVRSVEIHLILEDTSETQWVGEDYTDLELRTTIRLHNAES